MGKIKEKNPRWGFFLILAAWIAFVLGPFLAHFEALPPLAGFNLYLIGGLLGSIGFAASLLGRIRAGRAAAPPLLSSGVIAVFFLSSALPAFRYPPINDISTDTAAPPSFVAAKGLPANRGRDLSYPAGFSKKQSAFYPGIAPLVLRLSVDEAFRKGRQAAGEMQGWELTRVDPAAHALEGVATTRFFHFKDDFVIEVREGEQGGSVVHMRSKSRDGKGDVGANARRILSFFEKLKE